MDSRLERIAQVASARAMVASGLDGGPEASSAAAWRPYGPGKIVRTSCRNTWPRSVSGVVARAVSVWNAVLCAEAGRLMLACRATFRVSRSRVS
eukprot:12619962-Alexandrium_andersonii.AAC.1